MHFLKVLILFALSLSLTSCRTNNDEQEENGQESTAFFSVPPEKVTELTSNRLANEPSHFLRSQASSPINWQPWTPDILDLAERSQRLIFVVVGSTSHPQAQILTNLLEDKFAPEINERYVPVLADIEIDPALALACNALAGERGEPISFPFLMWLSHEGNPVAWIPVSRQNEENLLLGFRRAQNTVDAILDKSPRYVIENSRFDNERRLEIIKASLTLDENAEFRPHTRNDLFIVTQSLSDLYDPIEQTFDSTGGIPPGNLITSLARITSHPATPARLRSEAQTASKDAIELLAESALHDPLDGYFFSRRNSRSFAVPILSKNLQTQAEMLSAMASSPSTPASRRAIAGMLQALAQDPIAINALIPGETNELAFFWSVQAIEELLSPDEMTVVKAAFQLKNLGNIPSADDPRRLYFRRNTLGLKFAGPALARKVGKSEAETENLLQSAIKKMKARRGEILAASNALVSEDLPTLGATARLLTALVRTYAASPQPATLQYLEETGQRILTDFTGKEDQLLRVPASDTFRQAPASAYDYAVTIEALLEWYQLTWNNQLLDKANQLTTFLLDNFLDEDNYLVEAKEGDSPLAVPIHSIRMVFGPSTWGIAYGVLRKMSAMGYQHPKLADAIKAPEALLQTGLQNLSVIHTDFLLTSFDTLDGYLLLVSGAHQGNSSLRLALAQPEFDSVATMVRTSTTANLPSVGNNAAVLLKDGKVIQTFASTDAILSGLKSQLAQ